MPELSILIFLLINKVFDDQGYGIVECHSIGEKPC